MRFSDLALVQRLRWRGDRAAELICPASHLCSKPIGLVYRSVECSRQWFEELDARVDEFVRELADVAQTTIRTTKMAINVGLEQLTHSTMEFGSAMQRLTNLSPDHRSAFDSMLRKEAPVFRKK